MPDRHGWLSWDQYISAHDRNLARFPNFLVADGLSPQIGDAQLLWDGRLYFDGDIELCVLKAHDVRTRRGRIEVRTRRYAYQALLLAENGKHRLWRYDNASHYPAHPDEHHRHVLLLSGGLRIEHVGSERWPTLGDLIAILEASWHNGELDQLRTMITRRGDRQTATTTDPPVPRSAAALSLCRPGGGRRRRR